MIFPSEMSRVHILTHDRHSDKLVELLHEAGLMEISRSKLEGVEEGAMHPEVGICASHELRLTRIIEILKKYEKRKKGIRAALKPSIPEKVKVRKTSLDKKIKQADELLEDIEGFVIEAEGRIEEIEKRVEAIREDMEKLEKLSPLGIDLSWIGESRYVIIKAGTSSDLEALKESLHGKDVYIFSEQIDKDTWVVLLVAHSSLKEEIESVKSFDEIEVHAGGTPSNAINSLIKEKKELEKKKKKLIGSLRDIYRERKAILFAVREEMQIEKQRREIPERFGKTAYTSLIEGWCLSEDEEKLKDIVEKATSGEAFFSSKKADRSSEEAPIHLKMPEWANSFRTFLELFALPKYNEINPSMFLGISFILFFGIMLGDAGYGSIILIASLAAAYLEQKPGYLFLKNCLYFPPLIILVHGKNKAKIEMGKSKKQGYNKNGKRLVKGIYGQMYAPHLPAVKRFCGITVNEAGDEIPEKAVEKYACNDSCQPEPYPKE